MINKHQLSNINETIRILNTGVDIPITISKLEYNKISIEYKKNYNQYIIHKILFLYKK